MPLTLDAKDMLRDAGITQAAWARRFFADGTWHGDDCGCSDDRCIGYHHDENDECGCLPAQISTYERELAADKDARPIWVDYQAALATNDADAIAEALSAAENWVRMYQSKAVTSWSLDELVDGKAGISITNSINDQRWLVWEAS
jgi:hypothetical protein